MIVIVGAGPAGIAAAVRARQCGKPVTLVDDNPAAGGQIWRGGSSSQWFRKLAQSGARLIPGARVISGNAAQRTLQIETESSAFPLSWETLILATGARELFLPFPGWTLPNIMGVGGLQALVKSGLPVTGKRIIVAGSGPLLLAVAAYLRKRGAIVPLIAEQAPWSALFKFSLALSRHPAKLAQAAALRASLGTTPYIPNSWVVSAEGANKLEKVHLHQARKTRSESCDYLAIAYGFWPNSELACQLGCSTMNASVTVDDHQRTTIDSIYCAGETTGIGGVDLSLIEGEIAGYSAAGRDDLARQLFPARNSAHRFAVAFNQTFAPRAELRALAEPETLVCRCEDVSFSRLKSANSWRSAKLHFRCGMGPCQGRVCGPAIQFLFGWRAQSVRPPVFPARVASLISTEKGVPK